jgi:uncharacterized protein (DUF58 family)
LHRSPFTGFSVEFTEYRQYVPGDDLRYLDWKVLARSDRQYIRKFEDETNVRCELLVDHSRSMGFGSGDYSKADYARTLAAALGYFMLMQRDMVGLALFSNGLEQCLPARWRPGHLRRLLAALEPNPEGGATELGRALEDVARLWNKRSLVLILSDLLAPVASWDEALGHLVARGHDVRVLQILDPVELTLEFGQAAEWEDAETGQHLYLDPSAARKGYRERFEAHQAEVKRALERRGVPYEVATTDQPLDLVLLHWIERTNTSRGAAHHGRRGHS